jgi:hypothetical protein
MIAVRFWHSAPMEEFWRRFLQVDRSSGMWSAWFWCPSYRRCEGHVISLCRNAAGEMPRSRFWGDWMCLHHCRRGVPALLQCVDESLFDFGCDV